MAAQEYVMEKPETPFPRHWLYYIILKVALLLIAIGVVLKLFGFW
jgi:hypothetical protein